MAVHLQGKQLAGVVALASAMLTAVAWCSFEIRGVRAVLRGLESPTSQSEKPMPSTTITWVSGGLTITVTTTQGEEGEESDAAWAARTKAKVDAMLVKFPVD